MQRNTRIYRELLKTKMREDDLYVVKLESDLSVQTGCGGRAQLRVKLTFSLEQNAYKF